MRAGIESITSNGTDNAGVMEEEVTIMGWWTGSAPAVAKVNIFSGWFRPNSFLVATVTW